MKFLHRRFGARVALFLLLPLVSSAVPVWRSDDDNEEARWAVQSGRALPLAEILRRLDGRLGGDIIEVELDEDDGRYVYEFKVITRGGQLLEIEVDALSARILEIDD
jgi:uncharacterized membrane protein YkoI